MANTKKPITKRDLKFATLLFEGMKPTDAASKAYRWKCEPGSAKAQKACDLARAPRIIELVEKIRAESIRQAAAEAIVGGVQTSDLDSLHKFAFDRLRLIRDDEAQTNAVRFEAVKALEQLADPAQDMNLIQRYVDICWNGLTAHCPACHASFPLWKVKNKKLAEYREEQEDEKPEHEDYLSRRIYMFNQFEKRKDPHIGQLKALAAPERHIIGTGAARSGKSFLLGIMGMMFFLIPGVEIWILAKTYDDAKSEFEYIEKFIRSAFYPVDKHMVHVTFDRKTGEATCISKWGSELKIRSSWATGSITGRELEAMLVAEPAWIEADLFEEVRARMSSRLGRIIALGTPKGYGGFLARLHRMTQRDMRTGKRLPKDAKRIEQGCAWNQSIFNYQMKPQDNPEYVSAEIEAARGELTASEFAAEFEGEMVEDANAKFPHIKDDCLVKIPAEVMTDCSFVLGVDQGERNFASCLIGWDGKRLYAIDEYFDNTDMTIKANLVHANQVVGPTIRVLGGDADRWAYTIFDADPIINGQLYEMEDENREWKTEYTWRPKNKSEYSNWREETCLWLNELAKDGNLIFSIDKCDMLHEQLREALIRETPEGASGLGTKKGWVINDPWRGDHVPDAFLMAAWVIFNDSINLPSPDLQVGGALEEYRRAFEYKRIQGEKDDLSGYAERDPNSNEIFEDIFGRPQREMRFSPGVRGHYRDES